MSFGPTPNSPSIGVSVPPRSESAYRSTVPLAATNAENSISRPVASNAENRSASFFVTETVTVPPVRVKVTVIGLAEGPVFVMAADTVPPVRVNVTAIGLADGPTFATAAVIPFHPFLSK